jgi:hypothetical protein
MGTQRCHAKIARRRQGMVDGGKDCTELFKNVGKRALLHA